MTSPLGRRGHTLRCQCPLPTADPQFPVREVSWAWPSWTKPCWPESRKLRGPAVPSCGRVLEAPDIRPKEGGNLDCQALKSETKQCLGTAKCEGSLWSPGILIRILVSRRLITLISECQARKIFQELTVARKDFCLPSTYEEIYSTSPRYIFLSKLCESQTIATASASGPPQGSVLPARRWLFPGVRHRI